MAAAANFVSERKSSGVRHEDDDANYEDSTAFGDTYNPGDDMDDEKAAEVAPEVDAEIVNFHMDDQYLRRKWRRETVRSITRWFASTLAVLLASIAFCFLGGYMFSSMELFNEVETCKTNREKYYKGREKARDAILATANNFQLTQGERLLQYRQTLETFTFAYKNSSWKGDDCETMLPDWNFISATFFCVTVITSIGYGYIAPVTFWGRCVLIAYAIIGIPMFLAALASIGSFFSAVTHYTYHNLCCCGTCRESRMDAETRKQMKEQMLAMWRMEPNAPSAHFLEALEEDSEGDSSEEEAADEQAEIELVPVTVSLLILLSAVIFGGSIFAVTEDWNFLDGIYFSFVTVATIGFGDLVPGLTNTNTGKQSAFKFGLCWFYIIFGMTILSMSLQMIQENVEGSVKKILKYFSNAKKTDQTAEGDAGQIGEGAGERHHHSDLSSSSDDDANYNGNNNMNRPIMTARQFDRYPGSQLPGPGNWNIMPPQMMPPMMRPMLPNEFMLLENGSPSAMSRFPLPPPPPGLMMMGPNGPMMMPPLGMPMPPRPISGVSDNSRLSSAQLPPLSMMFRPPPSAMSNNRFPPPNSAQMMFRPPPSAQLGSAMLRPPPSAVSYSDRQPSAQPGSAMGDRMSSAQPGSAMWRPPPSAMSQQRESSAMPSGFMRPPPSALGSGLRR